MPATSNRIVRGPRASTAARRLPGPLSARVVTRSTVPPRPPCAKRPAPSAPGKASVWALRGSGARTGRKRGGAPPPGAPPSRAAVLEADARTDVELPAGVVDHRRAVAVPIDELVVELVGEVDRLRGQGEMVVDPERGRGIDVERRILALDIVDDILGRDALQIVAAIGGGAADAEPAVVIVERRIPAARRQVDEIVGDQGGVGRRGHIFDLGLRHR